MTFQRDDVVYNRQGMLGIVIGAAITIDHQVIYICEIPMTDQFTFFVGTEETLKHYEVEGRPTKRRTHDLSVFGYSDTCLQK